MGGAASSAYEEKRAEALARFSPRVKEVYGRFLQWLILTGVSEQALKVGDFAPDFLLPNAQGRLVSSQRLRQSGPLVLSFFRGSWCPFCTAELCALQSALPGLTALGAHLLAITPDTCDLPREFKRSQGLEFEILSDVDYGVGLAFGVIFSPPLEVREYYKERGILLPERHGSQSWMMPIPATYVVDQDGRITDAYVEADFTLRMDAGEIVERVRRLGARAAR